MMKRFLFLSIIFVIVGVVYSPAVAQDAMLRWHYAWESDTAHLYAFTTTGETRDLGVTETADGAYRIDDSRILYVTVKDNVYSYWVASPDGLRLLQANIPQRYLPTAYHAPYVVLTPVMVQGAPLTPNLSLLIHIEDGTTVEFPTAEPSYRRCCVFNADGTALHYLARTGTGIELRERRLETGEETVFYMLDITEETMFTAIFYGMSGEVWLITNIVKEGDSRFSDQFLVYADGTTQELSRKLVNDPTRQDYRLVGHALLTWNLICEADCTLTATDLLTQTQTIFDLGNGFSSGMDVEYVTPDTVIIRVLEDNSFIRLHVGSEPEVLGYWPTQKIGPTIVSTDKRWSILLNDPDEPQALVIWEHTQALPAHLKFVSDVLFVTTASYDPLWVVRLAASDRLTFSYNMQTGQGVDWESPVQTFPIPLSDSEALVFTPGTDDLAAGVYLMTQGSEEFTPLLSGNLLPLEGYALSAFNF